MTLRNARCNDKDNALHDLILIRLTVAGFVGTGSLLRRYSNGRMEQALGQLTLWRRNYILNFRTPCI